MRIFRSMTGVFIFLIFLLVGCGTPNSNTNNLADVQLTPTMHSAFQLTPASERMPYPVPIEGVGIYEIGGLGGNGEGETAVLESNADSSEGGLIEGQIPEGGLVEGELPSEAGTLVVNRVIAVTPLPRPVSPVSPASGNGASSGGSQPLSTKAPVSPANSSASDQTVVDSGVVPVTPDAICGGSQLNEVGPAPRVNSMPIDFEEFGTWTRTESTYGAFLLTSGLQKSGRQAAWVCYFFRKPGDETAVFTQIHPIPGQPNTVRMWVNGNRSGHYLGVWIVDNEQETWHIPLGSVLHDDWQEMQATFIGPNAASISHISGPNNGQIDFPIRFRGLAINDADDETITYGSIVVDDIAFVTR